MIMEISVTMLSLVPEKQDFEKIILQVKFIPFIMLS